MALYFPEEIASDARTLTEIDEYWASRKFVVRLEICLGLRIDPELAAFDHVRHRINGRDVDWRNLCEFLAIWRV